MTKIPTTHPPTEEEKKILASLLGKLYISPASNEDLTRDIYSLVCRAVDSTTLGDAPSRNSIYKIHVSLGKIVNALDAAAAAAVDAQLGYRRSVSRATSVSLDDARSVVSAGGSVTGGGRGGGGGGGGGGRSVAGEGSVKNDNGVIKEEDESEMGADSTSDEGTVVQGGRKREDKEEGEDSLVDDLLSEEEEEL